jgi:hypothetical protein
MAHYASMTRCEAQPQFTIEEALREVTQNGGKRRT